MYENFLTIADVQDHRLNLMALQHDDDIKSFCDNRYTLVDMAARFKRTFSPEAQGQYELVK
ncbi:hypothetical protein LCGC14_1513640 [marine sediment metagenome]|uniref:Uncharacterized protein n=1 Tax=marine sediment metagenome TaxID=412755 RepID=A0A0F9JLD2_9ZZZZ